MLDSPVVAFSRDEQEWDEIDGVDEACDVESATLLNSFRFESVLSTDIGSDEGA